MVAIDLVAIEASVAIKQHHRFQIWHQDGSDCYGLCAKGAVLFCFLLSRIVFVCLDWLRSQNFPWSSGPPNTRAPNFVPQDRLLCHMGLY